MEKIIKDYILKYKIELEDNELKLFEKFLELFIEKNSQINLSAIRKKDDIIEKHFIDSIMLNIFTEIEWKVADLWTGWGFPLIPLAIINPKAKFIWIDSVWKKLKAIDDFVQTLWLKNITTLNWRAEDIGRNENHRAQYDLVVSRATAFFPTLLEYTIPLLKVWGVFAAYKLDDKEELKQTKKALSKLNAKIIKVKNYTLWDQKRTIVFIEKIWSTHPRFPRKVWIPLKNPIK